MKAFASLVVVLALLTVDSSVAQNAPGGINQTGPNAQGTVINNNYTGHPDYNSEILQNSGLSGTNIYDNSRPGNHVVTQYGGFNCIGSREDCSQHGEDSLEQTESRVNQGGFNTLFGNPGEGFNTPVTSAPPETGFWYWCDAYQQYYPNIVDCPSGGRLR